VVVAGSIHYDVVLQLPHLPGDNDRIAPTAMTLAPGGMGGNVAAVVARLGGVARFVGQIADDEDGAALREDLVRDGVDVRWAGARHGSSWRGMILVGESGQRAILGAWPDAGLLERAPGQAPGLVRDLTPASRPSERIDIPTDAFAGENVAFACPFNFAPLVLHNVPEAVPVYMDIETGHTAGWPESQVWTILRRAAVLYGNTDNLAALARRLDHPSVTSLSRTLRGTVIETAAEIGCVLHESGERTAVPGFRVEAVDSSGAGDCFGAACTLALRRGHSLLEAARYANAAASLSTCALGCRSGIPTEAELDAFLAAHAVPVSRPQVVVPPVSPGVPRRIRRRPVAVAIDRSST
jgi:sugar/nucleoside kinase (ribokinase family)